jgi:hypothetical protein
MPTLPRPSPAVLLIMGMLLLGGVIAWSVAGRHATSRKSTMRVQLVLEPTHVHDPSKDLVIKVRIINDGPASVRLKTLHLVFPSLVLETRDAHGQPVPSGPPPVPFKDDGKEGRVVLGSGESWSHSYEAPFVIELDPGLYALRFHTTMVNGSYSNDWEGLLESDWVSFRVE